MSKKEHHGLKQSYVDITTVESQLFSAVEQNDRSQLRELILSNHCDARSIRNEQKETLLHVASKCGLLDIVRTLVEVYHLCPLEVDQHSLTSCHLACKFQHLHILTYFFRIGGYSYTGGLPPLHLPHPTEVPDEFSLHMLRTAASSESVLMTRFAYARMHWKLPKNMKLNLLHDSLGLLNKIFEPDLRMQKKNFKYVYFIASCCGRSLDILKLFENELVHFMLMEKSQVKSLYGSIFEAACRLDRTDIVNYLTKTKGLCPNQQPPLELIETSILQQYRHSDCVQRAYSPLYAAMLCGNILLVKSLISMSTDFYHEVVSHLSTGYGSILHPACVSGKLELVQLIVQEFQCDIDSQNKYGNTPLHVACEWGWLEIVQFLVASGCNVDLSNHCGHTPLTLAIKHNRVEIFAFLFSKDNVSFSVKTADYHETALHLACCCPDPQFALALLNDQRYSNCIDAVDEFGDTPLFNACRLGNIEVVCKLVAQPECSRLMVNHITQETPAHIASRNHRLDILKVLFAEGIDELLDVQLSGLGRRILQIACYNDSQDIIDFLIERKELISRNNPSYITAVHLACNRGSIETLRKLVLSGVGNITDTDNNENTILHCICLRQHVDRELIQFLSDDKELNQMLDKKNASGNTALNNIIMHDGVQILHCLSKYLSLEKLNKLLYSVDEKNNSPLHLAFRQEQSLTLKYLLNSKDLAEGVSKALCIQNSDNKSPLHLSSKIEYIDLLLKSPYLFQECISEAVALQDSNGNNAFHYVINQVVQNLHLLTVTTSTFHSFLERFQQADIVSVLCMKNKVDSTPLHLLLTKANSKMIRDQELVSRIILCLADSPLTSESIRSICSTTNSKGQTLVHSAASNSFMNAVTFLVERNMCDPTAIDSIGRTALHYTYMSKPKQITCDTAYILCQHGCSAHTLDKEGHSPVYCLFRHKNMSLLQVLISRGFCDPKDSVQSVQVGPKVIHATKYCYVMHPPDNAITVYLPLLHSMVDCGWFKHDDLLIKFIAEHKYCLQLRDSFGNTIIHMKSSYPLFENDLLEFSDCDLNAQNEEGNTPLHLACATPSPKLIKKLIESETCGKSLLIRNKYGHTPLYYLSNRELINLLVMNGADPKDVADTKRVKHLTDMFNAVKSKHPLNLTVTALVLGNSLAGKTTLLKSLTKAYSWDQLGQTSVGQIEDKCERTAGIEISEYKVVKERSLRVLFYDFAGHPEFHSTHSILLQNRLSFSDTQQDSPIVFVIVVDITAPDKLKQVIYWTKFIQNCQICCISGRKPEVIIIGSHVDQYSSSNDMHRKMKHSLNLTMEQMSDSVDLIEYPILLNCCEPNENELQKVKLLLMMSTEKLEKHSELDNRCHLIFSDLYKHYPDKPVKFSEYFEKLQKWQLTRGKVKELLINMHHMQHILLIGLDLASDAHDFWILTPKAQSLIFREVHGLLFASKDFDRCPLIESNVGIISSNKMKEMFPDFEYEMLQQFLIYSEFCKKINDRLVLELIEKGTTKSTEEQEASITHQEPIKVDKLCPLNEGGRKDYCNTFDYFFFPGLVNETREKRKLQWKSDDKYSYCSGWSLECTQDEFFNPLFLQVLLLRMTFQFATTTTQESVLHRRCIIWKNGVFWSAPGVEMLVEVTNQNQTVLVLVRCFKDTELEAVKLRSAVLKEVHKVKDKHSPATKVNEFIICSPNLDDSGSLTEPVKKVALTDIAIAITKGVKYVQDDLFQHHVINKDLLCFEPYTGIDNEMIISLFDPDESNRSFQDENLSNLFNLTEQDIEPRNAKLFMQLIRKLDKPILYKDLHHLFDEYSIFHGRDPKDMK